MGQHTHDRLVGIGFATAYLAAMTAMVLVTVPAFDKIRHVALMWAALPLGVVGAGLLLIAHARKVDPLRLARDPEVGTSGKLSPN